MPKLEFENLFLLSRREKRALKVPLNAQKLIIQGGNGFGKSAIIKSLYETLGTTPKKLDDRWKNEGVSSCLQFTYDGKRYTVVKTLSVYAMFDSQKRLLFSGQRLVKDWGPLLAKFFNFNLEMTDKEGESIVPPPAYLVAPFYIDQDGGWQKVWNSFDDYYLNETPRTLSEYHSGIKPSEYYSAKAQLAKEKIEFNELTGAATALRETISQIQQIDNVVGPTLDLKEFEADVDSLVKETNRLREEQGRFRALISDIHEEVHLLQSEKNLILQALKEMREEFEFGAALPDEVECPTCGQEYHNSLADRFGLIADEGVLTDALGRVNADLGKAIQKEARERNSLSDIQASLDRMQDTLNIQRASVSLNDVVIAAGKTEAAKMLRTTLQKKLLELDDVQTAIDGFNATMKALTDKKRTSEILKHYRTYLASYSQLLDVQLDNAADQAIAAVKASRGSEGPRALLAYYYAFLQTKSEFTTDAWFPIVIDAPNQQGQDKTHLPQMVKFIFDNAPKGSQIILATEDAGKPLPGVRVDTYGVKQRQVLRDSEFEAVSAVFEPYVQAILASTGTNP